MSTILKTVATTPALTPPSPKPPPLPASFHLQSPEKLQPILAMLGVTIWLKYKSKERVILAVVKRREGPVWSFVQNHHFLGNDSAKGF